LNDSVSSTRQTIGPPEDPATYSGIHPVAPFSWAPLRIGPKGT
jgi:hypothetical protein